MKNFLTRVERRLIVPCFGVFFLTSVLAQHAPIRLEVDATDAPRKRLHATLHIPAQPGPMTLLYPKWIPGEHSPTGPITDLVGLSMSAGSKSIAWVRDAEEMCAFHVTVPPGANALDVALDFLLPPSAGDFSSGASATSKLLDLSWNEVLLYPKGARASQVLFAATLRLPEGWKFGTALPPVNQSGSTVEFAPVSLETLIDSPVIAGTFFRTVELTPVAGVPHSLHMVADSAVALEIKPEDVRHFSRLVAEADALFGARHYRSYHFLLTLSDHVAHFGLEHHESSDNRTFENYLTDEDARRLEGFLLPHEMVHSWNGKYRRPAGLATPDYQQPMKGELLWVYEGLTDYLGAVLSARSGLWTNESFRQYLALEAAELELTPGRTWRPLADTTIAAQLLYFARPEGAAWRRGVDFYAEGDLIWLEADVLIRQQSQGRRSLDDFCKRFCGGESGAPKVVPYTLDDMVSVLNETAAYDWRQFFQARVYAANSRAPLGGIEAAGWRLTYTHQVPDMLRAHESRDKVTDVSFSIGLKVKEDGSIEDVVPGSAADKAGVAPAMKLVAVNGRRWSPEILRTAIISTRAGSPALELLVENEDYFKTAKLEYHDGEKYPQLERVTAKPDLLSEILKPSAPEPK